MAAGRTAEYVNPATERARRRSTKGPPLAGRAPHVLPFRPGSNTRPLAGSTLSVLDDRFSHIGRCLPGPLTIGPRSSFQSYAGDSRYRTVIAGTCLTPGCLPRKPRRNATRLFSHSATIASSWAIAVPCFLTRSLASS